VFDIDFKRVFYLKHLVGDGLGEGSRHELQVRMHSLDVTIALVIDRNLNLDHLLRMQVRSNSLVLQRNDILL